MRNEPTLSALIRRHIAATVKDHPRASLERVADLVFCELVGDDPRLTRSLVLAEMKKTGGSWRA